MTDTPPRVIVCLPSYNAETFIERTLDCLKKQTYPNFRVYISDDCSTDDTVSIVKSSIHNDERFHLIQQEKNLGWINNVDFLLEKAANDGNYTFIMPHDDTIEKEYVEKLISTLEENPDAVLSFSDMNFNDRDPSEVARYTAHEGVKNRLKRLKLLLKRKQIWWTAYRGMMRSDVVKKIVPSQKNMFGNREYAADWYLLIRLAMYGKFVRVPEVLYTKYYHDGNASHRLKHTHINYYGNLATAFVMMFRSPIGWREMIIFQALISKQAIRYFVNISGIHSLLKRLKIL